MIRALPGDDATQPTASHPMKPLWILLLVPIAYAAAVADTSLAERIEVGHVAPDLLALTAVIWLLVGAGPRGFLTAGAIGLAADLVSPGRLGLGMACFLLVGYAITRLRQRLAMDALPAQVVLVFGAVTLLAAGVATGRCLLGETAVPLAALLLRSLGVGLYTAGVSLPLLMVLGWIREPLVTRRRKLAEF
jgi:rod shape-determining protein MreD